MARHGFTKFGVILVIFITSQQYQFSNAQQCRVSCSQTGYKGKLRYSRALEVAQTREHELDDNFGPQDLPIRYRNKRSDMGNVILENSLSEEFSTMRKVLQVTENNPEWDLEKYYAENEELLGAFHSRREKRQAISIGSFCQPFDSLSFNVSMPYLSAEDNRGIISAYSSINPCSFVLCTMGIIAILTMLPEILTPPALPPPINNPPQPGEPGGGGIPTGNSLIQAEALLASLGLLGEVVAVFPPYADGSIVSPRTGFRTFAAIHTDDLNPRIAQSRQEQFYGSYEPLFGVAQETFFVDDQPCTDDPYAYDSCSKYDEFLALYTQFAQSRQERNFVFRDPTCRKTC